MAPVHARAAPLRRFVAGGRRAAPWLSVGLLAFGALALVSSGGGGQAAVSVGALAGASPAVSAVPTDLPPTPGAVPDLSLNTGVAPPAVCAAMQISCPAGTGETRVQLTASALGPGSESWPAVQVVFVMETTSYMGDYGTDTSGLDPCAAGQPQFTPLCEESNAIPFFVANAGTIAQEIQAANPHSNVSFAMVDYYDAWSEPWDDEDGPEYHVDIGSFVPAGDFGQDVHSTFQQQILGGGWYSWDQDMDNNFLDASEIAALYGAIVGSQLDWSANTHHVIVWLGSSAPRDPHYIEDYCVSASSSAAYPPASGCNSQSCEPAYTFSGGEMPPCEGWVQSQDGNPADSIAALAHDAPACTDSIGGVCTVDAIDVWTTTTDPYSYGWPSQFANKGGGPGGAAVIQNVARILEAGCDIAAATDGSWDGPAFATCPNGQSGTLQYVAHGSVDKPNTANPSLLEALSAISFGPVRSAQVAHGQANSPMFVYVPIGNIQVAPTPNWATACQTPTGFSPHCQVIPSLLNEGGVRAYGWNWSDQNFTDNAMDAGDVWTASFNVIATGPPYTLVPVDACISDQCKQEGSGAVSGVYTWANYLQNQNKTGVLQTFPPGVVHVEAPPAAALAPVPPSAPPPAPPGLPVPAPNALPVTNPLIVFVQTGTSVFSINAVTAGFLGAGFMRVGMKNRPLKVGVSNVNAAMLRRQREDNLHMGRFQ